MNKRGGRMWTPSVSLELATRIYDGANIAFLISLVVGVIATALIMAMGTIKESHWEKERTASNERIAELGKETAEANKKAVEAGEGTAMALAKGAALEKEAATARLETEKLKAVVTWRSIPLDSTAAMEKVLSAKPGSVNLRYMDGDPEALYLAIQISTILERSHWRIAPGSLKPMNGIIFGINIPKMDRSDGQTLGEALSAARMPFATEPMPSASVGFGVSTIDGAPILMIGSRRPVLP